MAQIPDKGFNWHELMTTDSEKAVEFYQQITGLTVAPGDYRMIMDG